MALELRAFEDGDAPAILDLFEASFGRPMPAEFWRWRYLDHPGGGPLIELAFDGDMLAAHYGVSRDALTLDATDLPAGLSMTTMTHPGYRGRRLFAQLAERLYARMAAEGAAGVHGFPNAMIHPSRQAHGGWLNIAAVPTLTLDVARAQAGNPDERIRQAPAIDESFSRFLRKESGGRGSGVIRTRRDAEVLRWRVDDNPVNIYQRRVLDEGAGEIAGYAITKRFGDSGLDLVEMRAADGAAARALLAGVIAAAAADGVARISTWCALDDPQHAALERAGFGMDAPVTYHGGRAFTQALDEISDGRRWRRSMLDSDLY